MEALNPRPQGLEVVEIGGCLMVTRKWYNPTVWPMTLFSLSWNAFFFYWYARVLSQPSPDKLALWFPVLHVGVGVFTAYQALTGFLNRTEFKVGNGKIIVHHGPLPWPGNKTVQSNSVQQLFCDDIQTYGRTKEERTFRLNAVMVDGRKESLLSVGLARDEALYLEKLVESRLGLAPAPVIGELK